MLRRKNKLMRFGRVEEAGALAGRIGTEITRRNEGRLLTVSRKSSKDLWGTGRQLTGRKQDEGAAVDGVTAESLNDHYTAISTDHSYAPPHRRQYTATDVETEYVNEWRIFNPLDQLHPTATRLDGLPAWFLRLGHHYSANRSLISLISPSVHQRSQCSGRKYVFDLCQNGQTPSSTLIIVLFLSH